MSEPDSRNGIDPIMKKRRKWLIAAVLLVAGGALFPRAKLYADFRRGEAVAMSRDGEIEIVVNGRRSKAPRYRLDAAALSPRLRGLHAFKLDSNARKTAVAPRDPALGGALFWLAEAKVGVTQCASLFNVSRLGSRRMLVSETALNCTYDAQDDMKGLAASVEVGADATSRSYRCRFERAGKPVEVEFLVPVSPAAAGQRP